MTNSNFARLFGLLALLSVVAGCTASIDAGKPSSSTCFLRVFGGTFNDSGMVVQQTPDGGYITLSTSSSYPVEQDKRSSLSSSILYLVKFDATGTEQWEQEFGTTQPERAVALVQTGDGYVMLGSTYGFGYVKSGFYLVKSDLSGSPQPLFESHFKSDSLSGRDERSNEPGGMVALQDGGFLIVGSSAHDSVQEACMVRTDRNGVVQWRRTYPAPKNAETFLSGVTQSRGSSFVATGTRIVNGQNQIYFLRTDTLGNFKSEKVWGSPSDATGIDLRVDQGFIVYGRTQNDGASMLFVDDSFSFSYGPAYPGDKSLKSWLTAGARTPDGGAIAVGTTNATANGSFDIMLMKVDAQGNRAWSRPRIFGGAREDFGAAVWPTSDGGYIILGSTNSFGPGFRNTGSDVIMIKVNADGNLCN